MILIYEKECNLMSRNLNVKYTGLTFRGTIVDEFKIVLINTMI
jgi:hypothetical protein